MTSIAADGAAAPAVAVDVAVFTVRDGLLQVLLVEIRHGPFTGWLALPGGRVRPDETLDEAAARELEAQTTLRGVYLEQLYTFGHPGRDPLDRVVSVAYVALIAPGRSAAVRPGAKYARVAWRPLTGLAPLAYDHGAVIGTALPRLRAKLSYTNLAYALVPEAFTLGELQAVYEAILGRNLDRRNFRKKVLSLALLKPVGRERRGAHRPAALYAFRRRRPMVVDVL